MLKNVPFFFFTPKSIYLIMVMKPHCWRTLNIISILGYIAPVEFVGYWLFYIIVYDISLLSFINSVKKKISICNILTFPAAIIFSILPFLCIPHTHITSDIMTWPLPLLEANVWSQSLSSLMSYLLRGLPFPIGLSVMSPKRQMDSLYTLLSFIFFHLLSMNSLCNGH